MLRVREGDVERGIPINPKMDRMMFEEAAQDLIHDYEANNKKSIRVLKQRIAKHLTPFFRGRRMATIRPPDIRAYVVERQRSLIVTGSGDTRRERHPANGLINRELTTLKRMFSLAVQSEKLARRPHIPFLAEAPPRAGFFDRDQIEAICRHLTAAIAAVIRFGYFTGWRLDSEVLTLQWANVDWKGQQVRLEAGTAKNGEPRVFPFTDDLRTLLEPPARRDAASEASGTDRALGLPPQRQADQELHQRLAHGVSEGGQPRPHSARSSAHGRPQPRARGCPPVNRDGDGGTQDRIDLPAVRDR